MDKAAMMIGTVLKDNRTGDDGVYYGDDGDHAVVFDMRYINCDVCAVVKIPWAFLSVTGQIIPMGAIPSRYVWA